MEEVEVGPGKYSGNYRNHRSNDQSCNRWRSSLRADTNRDRIRCFKCREYGHIANDCPNSDMERESEQIQQMYNLDKSQTVLQVLVADSYDDLIRTNSEDAI